MKYFFEVSLSTSSLSYNWIIYVLRGLDDELMEVRRYYSRVRQPLVDEGHVTQLYFFVFLREVTQLYEGHNCKDNIQTTQFHVLNNMHFSLFTYIVWTCTFNFIRIACPQSCWCLLCLRVPLALHRCQRL